MGLSGKFFFSWSFAGCLLGEFLEQKKKKKKKTKKKYEK